MTRGYLNKKGQPSYEHVLNKVYGKIVYDVFICMNKLPEQKFTSLPI